eukprot:4932319-Alexandrium_andersonii.AAC.1
MRASRGLARFRAFVCTIAHRGFCCSSAGAPVLHRRAPSDCPPHAVRQAATESSSGRERQCGHAFAPVGTTPCQRC